MDSRLDPKWLWTAGLGLSLVLHLSVGGVIGSAHHDRPKGPERVKVKVVEKAPEKPKVEATPVPPPPPPPSKPKPRPKPKAPPKVATERPQPKVPDQPPPPPVQGLSASSMSPGGKVAVPLGNTLMTDDKGIRSKEPPPPMDADLSADAKLVHESVVKPQYTDAAIDANLEGTFIVSVFVDENGTVTDAELKKKPGLGMDERLLAAAKAAKFVPRKNKLGRPESGWTEIRFSLQIP